MTGLDEQLCDELAERVGFLQSAQWKRPDSARFLLSSSPRTRCRHRRL